MSENFSKAQSSTPSKAEEGRSVQHWIISYGGIFLFRSLISKNVKFQQHLFRINIPPHQLKATFYVIMFHAVSCNCLQLTKYQKPLPLKHHLSQLQKKVKDHHILKYYIMNTAINLS